ncbi:LIM/homeobox protein Awh-like [Mytilus galloprovincialis]|uniref:LHX6_8 n=2 Tax=Mytilus TaxID=6548 RepID=A0A8S3TYR8_MYTED|nr:LHX6_8 [Mytilus edulis]
MRMTDNYEFTDSLPSGYEENVSSPDSAEDAVDRYSFTMLKPDGELCFGCGDLIVDRYLLRVNDQSYHVSCLRCCTCQIGLERQSSCYIKGNNVYCKLDYTREFGAKCSKCLRSIQPNDWVRKARDNVYHLACFACDSCKRQLSTGEEFALQEDQVLCKTHYVESLEGGPSKEDGNMKSKTKRVRTTFTEEQVQVLQANFQLDSNPDGQDLERIAQITGLSKRVTQVWFQNSRARQKKQQQQSRSDCGNSSPSPSSSPSKISSPSHWMNSSDSIHSDSMSYSE